MAGRISGGERLKVVASRSGTGPRSGAGTEKFSKRDFFKVSLRGRCRRQGAPRLKAYLVAVGGPPPLSLRDISPRKGGRGDLRVLQRSAQGGKRGSAWSRAFLALSRLWILCSGANGPCFFIAKTVVIDVPRRD